MKFEKKLLKALPFLFLVFAIGFNLWLLWPEATIKSDPNDNIFQFGLVNRMDQVWQKVVRGETSFLALIDHWVPNWAEGYPLPFYYSHLPHLALVGSYRLVISPLVGNLTLFGWFHFVQYLILAFTPLSFYFGSRKFGLSKLASALVALFASQLATDGLYGLDISSYAWRGYGLFLQALSVFFLPLMLGSTWQAVKKNKNYLAAILWLTACLASHIATGYIGLLSCALIPLALVKLPLKDLKPGFFKLAGGYFRLASIFGVSFLILSYWFIPLFFNNQYHAVSFWDPPSKWFSYGFQAVINFFLNGDLLDYGRRPLLTGLTIIGFLVAAYRAQKPKYRFFFLLFPFWFILFFGQPTLGGLIKLLPLTGEYHLHRFIIGVHLASLFLIGIGAEWLLCQLKRLKLSKLTFTLGALVLVSLLAWPVYQQTYRYQHSSNLWLKDANFFFEQDWPDFEKILHALSERPRGRIWAGRPGNWGREFKVGATPVYMALSVRGFEESGFLPETWSLNSDAEQFFDENDPVHYNLYNLRYLLTPNNHPLPNFAKEIMVAGKYKLSEVETTGYFDLGYSDLAVMSGKKTTLNPIHAWLVSDWVKLKQSPTLVLNGESDKQNQITMTGAAAFNAYGQNYNLFTHSPFTDNQAYQIQPKGKVVKEEAGFQKFLADVEAEQECLVVFKMTYHPNWTAKIDGKKARKAMVFPSFIAVKISPGHHRLELEYQPQWLKIPWLIAGAVIFLGFAFQKKKISLKDF